MQKLLKIRTACAELLASQKAGATAKDLIESLSPHAMLRALPESFSLLASTILPVADLQSETVIATIQQEWRRRHQSEDSTAVLVARKKPIEINNRSQPKEHGREKGERKKGKDGNWLYGSHEDEYCDSHRAYGHRTSDCRRPQARAMAASKTPHFIAVGEDQGPGSHAVGTFVATQNLSALLTSSTDVIIVVDSGATDTFVNDESLLTNVIPLVNPIAVSVGDNRTIPATKRGDLKLGGIVFKDVLLVPRMGYNLLSVRKQGQPGSTKWEFNKTSCALLDAAGTTLLAGQMEHGLYVLRAKTLVRPSSPPSALLADSSLLAWHRRLGHLNVRDVLRLGRSGRLGKGWTAGHSEDVECDECVIGKGTRLPTHPSDRRAATPLETIHVDLWGPARIPSKGGQRYFLTCYDDYTRKIHLFFIYQKSEATAKIMEFVNLAENQLTTSVKIVRSDLGGEFTSRALDVYFKSKGIEHHTIPPDAHSQNGRVERAHLTILNDVRTLLADSKLPRSYWAEAAAYAVYTRSRALITGQDESPEDRWSGRTVRLDHLRPFGSRVLYRDHKEKDKLNPRYREAVLLGYQPGTTYYRVLDKITGSTVCTRDAAFPQHGTKETGAKHPRQRDVSNWELELPIEDATSEGPFEDGMGNNARRERSSSIIPESDRFPSPQIPSLRKPTENKKRDEQPHRGSGGQEWTLERDPRGDRLLPPSPSQRYSNAPRRTGRHRGYDPGEPGFYQRLD